MCTVCMLNWLSDVFSNVVFARVTVMLFFFTIKFLFLNNVLIFVRGIPKMEQTISKEKKVSFFSSLLI